jgi:hypothetical protein
VSIARDVEHWGDPDHRRLVVINERLRFVRVELQALQKTHPGVCSLQIALMHELIALRQLRAVQEGDPPESAEDAAAAEDIIRPTLLAMRRAHYLEA